jgi:hypothetical protein
MEHLGKRSVTGLKWPVLQALTADQAIEFALPFAFES